MSDGNGNSEFGFEGDSTATLDPVGNASDPSLLDELAKKLNAAPIQTESVDFERMQQLETRLADREQLVSILTDRLEQAADELDRIKRSGGALSGSGTKVPPCVAWKQALKSCENVWNRQLCTVTSRQMIQRNRVSRSTMRTALDLTTSMDLRSICKTNLRRKYPKTQLPPEGRSMHQFGLF
jgi:hypothetical protein